MSIQTNVPNVDLTGMSPCEKVDALENLLIHISAGRVTQVRYGEMWQMWDRGSAADIRELLKHYRRECSASKGGSGTVLGYNSQAKNWG